jgi:hypothetical protein
MLFIRRRGVFTRFRVNRLNPQLLHQTPNPLGIDRKAVLFGQGIPQPAAAARGSIRIELIDQRQQLQFERLTRWIRLRPVIRRRPAQPQQIALTPNRRRLFAFIQHAPFSLQRQAQALVIFFSSS